MILVLLAQIAGLPDVKGTPVAEAITQCVVDIKTAQAGGTASTGTKSNADLGKELQLQKANLEAEILELKSVMETNSYGKDATSYRKYLTPVIGITGNAEWQRLSEAQIDSRIQKVILEKIRAIGAINVKLAKAGLPYDGTDFSFLLEDNSSDEDQSNRANNSSQSNDATSSSLDSDANLPVCPVRDGACRQGGLTCLYEAGWRTACGG